MTEPTTTPTPTAAPPTESTEPAGPFTPGDPLNYAELSGEARGWRAVLHLLAVTGRTLPVPAALTPAPAVLAVCAGWRYRYHWADTEGWEMVLSAGFTGWPEPIPGEDRNHHASRLFDHLADINRPTARPYACPSCHSTVLRAASVDSGGAAAVILDAAGMRLCGAPVTTTGTDPACALPAGHHGRGERCANAATARVRGVDLAAVVATDDTEDGGLTAVWGVPYAGDPDFNVAADAPRYRPHTCRRSR